MGNDITREMLLQELKIAYKVHDAPPENAISLSEISNLIGLTVQDLKKKIENGEIPDGWKVETFKAKNGREAMYFVKN